MQTENLQIEKNTFLGLLGLYFMILRVRLKIFIISMIRIFIFFSARELNLELIQFLLHT